MGIYSPASGTGWQVGSAGSGGALKGRTFITIAIDGTTYANIAADYNREYNAAIINKPFFTAYRQVDTGFLRIHKNGVDVGGNNNSSYTPENANCNEFIGCLSLSGTPLSYSNTNLRHVLRYKNSSPEKELFRFNIIQTFQTLIGRQL
jgi:hypothetical protein